MQYSDADSKTESRNLSSNRGAVFSRAASHEVAGPSSYEFKTAPNNKKRPSLVPSSTQRPHPDSGINILNEACQFMINFFHDSRNDAPIREDSDPRQRVNLYLSQSSSTQLNLQQ